MFRKNLLCCGFFFAYKLAKGKKRKAYYLLDRTQNRDLGVHRILIDNV